MHAAARQFVEKTLVEYGPITGDVVELGSRNANGGVRDLFPQARSYLGIDITPGEGVDVVQDAASWQPQQAYACVISTETFEHTPRWRDMLRAGATALAPDGIMVITCATAARQPHSATIAEQRPAPGEYYRNVSQQDFQAFADQLNLKATVTTSGNDLYAICRAKPPTGPGLKVIGAGMWRTATVSLKSALEQLTGQPCHHMTELLRNPGQTHKWLAVVRGQQPQWEELLAGYGSCLDWPSLAYWQELYQANPDALVLLSIRPAEDWWKSIEATVLQSAPTPETARTPWDHLVVELFKNHFVGRFPTRQQAITAYNQHNETVRRTVAPNRLIEWTPADGWLPLCRALEVAMPERPFPHLNSSDEYRENNKLRSRSGKN